jgi:vacuolar-type H+-ATPase subunit H
MAVNWLPYAGAVAGGALASLGLQYFLDDEDDEDDYDAEDEKVWKAVYLKKGERYLARFLKREEVADDLEEAEDMVSDWLEENPKIVRKMERKILKKAKRRMAQVAKDSARDDKAQARRLRNERQDREPATLPSSMEPAGRQARG